MTVVEQHPLQPFLPTGARLLMLGSFPPARKRWSMDFFYPNYTNDMWRIFGLCFFGDKLHFVDEERKTYRRESIIELLNSKGIALYDTACAVVRTKNTASDKDLEIVQQTDVEALLRQMPLCEAVVTTGQKATDVFTGHFNMSQPKVGTWLPFQFEGRSLRLYRMPSSSRAYPMRVEKKAESYLQMFQDLSLLAETDRSDS